MLVTMKEYKENDKPLTVHLGTNTDGKFEGLGEATFKDGNKYTGSFSNGLMHGNGVYEWRKEGVIYEGEFQNNQIIGNGTYRWANGSTYVGQVYRGFRHGKGTFHSNDVASIYVGDWVLGKKEGTGTMYFNEDRSSYYEGEWQDDEKHGKGTMVYHGASGSTLYEGNWRGGEKDGFGKMIWSNAELKEIYIGEWKQGEPNGTGIYYWLRKEDEDESVTTTARRNYYTGQWEAGHRSGKGIFFYADGAIYSGEWKNNKKEGTGVFCFPDGTIYQGVFKADKPLHLDKSSAGFGSNPTLNIDDITPGKPDQVQQTQLVLQKYINRLKDQYQYYSNLGRPTLDDSYYLNSFQFQQFLKDSEIPDRECSVAALNDAIARVPIFKEKITGITTESRVQRPQDPATVYLFRDFLECIVRISKVKYSYEDTLQDSLSLLLSKNILKNSFKNRVAIKRKLKDQFFTKLQRIQRQNTTAKKGVAVKSTVYDDIKKLQDELPLDLAFSKDTWNMSLKLANMLFSVYNSKASGGEVMLLRDFLVLLQEKQLLDSVLRIEIVTLFFQDEEGAFNIEQQLSLQDFVEIVANCALIKYGNQQKEDNVFLTFANKLAR